jgi:hypothetical protein
MWRNTMADKLQQEIEDLLARLDTFPPPKPWHVRARESIGNVIGGVFSSIAGFKLPWINPGYAVLIAIVVIVMAYFLYDDLGSIARWIIIGAIVAFIVAFVLSLRRHSQPPPKYWRDRPMDVNKPGREWRDRRRR